MSLFKFWKTFILELLLRLEEFILKKNGENFESKIKSIESNTKK